MNALWWIPIGWIGGMFVAMFFAGLTDMDVGDENMLYAVVFWPVTLLVMIAVGLHGLGVKCQK